MTDVIAHDVEPTGDPYAVPERRNPSQQTNLVNGVRAALRCRAHGGQHPGRGEGAGNRICRFREAREPVTAATGSPVSTGR